MGFIQKIVSIIGWSVLLCLIFGVIGALLVARGGDSEKLAISTKNAVGLVELEGEISNSKKFRKSLKKFVDNDKIKALVVRIDSPGGAVGASEEMYRAVKNAAEKKPVVCALGNTAASGGLYTAVGCQKIVSNRGTITGSIGVILMTPNIANVVDKVGFKMNVIKSGKFKDSGSPFREMTEDDRGLLQRLIVVLSTSIAMLIMNSCFDRSRAVGSRSLTV
ncbi:UNVERIFIED_CONTAM: hypothetical protein GTU68_004896 [Idotea baltica]|nr:hypothetical protein [Idotea baltica]